MSSLQKITKSDMILPPGYGGVGEFVALEFLGETRIEDVMQLRFLMTREQFSVLFASRYLEFDFIQMRKWASAALEGLQILRPRVEDYGPDTYRGARVFRMVLSCDGWAGVWPRDFAMWVGK